MPSLSRPRPAPGLACCLALALLALSGCGVVVDRHRVAVAPAPARPMLTASATELRAAFNREANAVQSLKLKMELALVTGGPRLGVVSNYPEVTTFLLFQKPADLRLFGNVTVFGKIFDMASDGGEFQVSLPRANKFMVGHNDMVPASTANPLEKLRPGVILEALLINPIEPTQSIASMNDRAETFAEYGVLVQTHGSDGIDHLQRRIVFSRYDLLPVRQIIYDQNGFPATQATYAKYQLINGVHVPTLITINRPADEYSLTLTITDPADIEVNPAAVAADTWHLVRPPNYQLINLDQLPDPGAAGPPADSAKLVAWPGFPSS